jgi:hypothetical protein
MLKFYAGFAIKDKVSIMLEILSINFEGNLIWESFCWIIIG